MDVFDSQSATPTEGARGRSIPEQRSEALEDGPYALARINADAAHVVRPAVARFAARRRRSVGPGETFRAERGAAWSLP